MSSTNSPMLEGSYMTNDSDRNCIPGYIIETAEGNVTSNDDSDDCIVIGLAYADKPLAYEQWLDDYNKQEKERLDRLEMLQKCLNGSVNVSEWLVVY